MKKIMISIGLIILFLSTTFSQDYKILNTIEEEILRMGINPVVVRNYNEITGTPYLFSQMLDGKIITKKDKVLIGKLRYNIYTDEVEFEYKNTIQSFANPSQLKEFYIEYTKLLFVRFYEANKIKQGYMIVNVEGDYTMLTKKTILFKEKELPQPYTTPKPDRFVPLKDNYYLLYKGNTLHKIENKKKLIKAFPELKSIIEKFNQKVDFENQEEIKTLVEYINKQVSSS